MAIYDAAMRYQAEGVSGLRRPGVRDGQFARLGRQDAAARRAGRGLSHERIFGSNSRMGVLALQFSEGVSAETLKLDGTETFGITLSGEIKPRMGAKLAIRRRDGREETVVLRVRIDTPIEVDYYRHGGILPYVLRQLAS
jgi:aconitate hydratase